MEPFGVWWYGTLSVVYFISIIFFHHHNHDDTQWETRDSNR